MLISVLSYLSFSPQPLLLHSNFYFCFLSFLEASSFLFLSSVLDLVRPFLDLVRPPSFSCVFFLRLVTSHTSEMSAVRFGHRLSPFPPNSRSPSLSIPPELFKLDFISISPYSICISAFSFNLM